MIRSTAIRPRQSHDRVRVDHLEFHDSSSDRNEVVVIPIGIAMGARAAHRDKITVSGRQAKSGAPYMNLTERANIVMTDSGKEIFRTANYGQGPNALQEGNLATGRGLGSSPANP